MGKRACQPVALDRQAKSQRQQAAPHHGTPLVAFSDWRTGGLGRFCVLGRASGGGRFAGHWLLDPVPVGSSPTTSSLSVLKLSLNTFRIDVPLWYLPARQTCTPILHYMQENLRTP